MVQKQTQLQNVVINISNPKKNSKRTSKPKEKIEEEQLPLLPETKYNPNAKPYDSRFNTFGSSFQPQDDNKLMTNIFMKKLLEDQHKQAVQPVAPPTINITPNINPNITTPPPLAPALPFTPSHTTPTPYTPAPATSRPPASVPDLDDKMLVDAKAIAKAVYGNDEAIQKIQKAGKGSHQIFYKFANTYIKDNGLGDAYTRENLNNVKRQALLNFRTRIATKPPAP